MVAVNILTIIEPLGSVLLIIILPTSEVELLMGKTKPANKKPAVLLGGQQVTFYLDIEL
jgi:hypothetical protein